MHIATGTVIDRLQGATVSGREPASAHNPDRGTIGEQGAHSREMIYFTKPESNQIRRLAFSVTRSNMGGIFWKVLSRRRVRLLDARAFINQAQRASLSTLRCRWLSGCKLYVPAKTQKTDRIGF